MANSLGRSTAPGGKVAGILMTLLPVVVFCFLLGGGHRPGFGRPGLFGRRVGPAGPAGRGQPGLSRRLRPPRACSSRRAPGTRSRASSSACSSGSSWSSSSPTWPPRSPRASSRSSPGTTSTPSSGTWTRDLSERIQDAVREAPAAGLEHELVDERRRRRLPRNVRLHGFVFRAPAPRDGPERADAARQRRPEVGAAESPISTACRARPGPRKTCRCFRRPGSSGPWPRPSAARTARAQEKRLGRRPPLPRNVHRLAQGQEHLRKVRIHHPDAALGLPQRRPDRRGPHRREVQDPGRIRRLGGEADRFPGPFPDPLHGQGRPATIRTTIPS